MEAKDLRSGNIFHDKKSGKDVALTFQITHYVAGSITLNLLNLDSELEPIPLTAEWLLKFGAEQLNKHKLMMGQEFFTCNSKGEIFWERDYDRDEQIHYVHQLQNLYFSLTGQELTLIK